MSVVTMLLPLLLCVRKNFIVIEDLWSLFLYILNIYKFVCYCIDYQSSCSVNL